MAIAIRINKFWNVGLKIVSESHANPKKWHSRGEGNFEAFVIGIFREKKNAFDENFHFVKTRTTFFFATSNNSISITIKKN